MDRTAEKYRREHPRLTDEASRRDKAAKILAVLREFGSLDLAHLSCIDLGCGSGIIAATVADTFRNVVAVDLDPTGVAFARSGYPHPHLAHLVADATRLPLASHTVDVVICTHVYEHVTSAESLVAEIRRVIRPGGMVFFSGPNRWRLYEPHLRLWFLHWLPRPLTNAVLSALGRPPYEEHLVSRRALLRLLRQFDVRDLNPPLVAQPERFGTASEPGIALARRLPRRIRDPLLAWFAPSFNFLLTPMSSASP